MATTSLPTASSKATRRSTRSKARSTSSQCASSRYARQWRTTLREVIAALKIAGVVERIGDYSKNIAKASKEIGGNRKQFEPLTLLPAMADVAAEMVHDVLTAYAARDAELAREVIATDEKVDAFYNSIFRNLVSHMVENPATISSAAQMLFVARNLERIGDHATNVAEMVHFAANRDLSARRGWLT